MTLPRRVLVSEQDTPYYHIVSRCVRRAFLCGSDPLSGQSYEHRRQWVEDRIRILSSLFAIDVCAYAVMSNHYHIVLKLDSEQAGTWSDLEIARRWTALFKGPILLQNWMRDGSIAATHEETLQDILAVLRQRLSSLSWFMKCLNEPIARRANREDGCTGHFWEARFKSQAIRNDADLMACMTYVDLNPVRACIAETPEDSEFTSFKERTQPCFDPARAVAEQIERGQLIHEEIMIKPLLPFTFIVPCSKESMTNCLPFRQTDYFQLVDWAGRVRKPEKRGHINSSIEPIFTRLGAPPDDWLNRALNYENTKPIYHKLSSAL